MKFFEQQIVSNRSQSLHVLQTFDKSLKRRMLLRAVQYTLPKTHSNHPFEPSSIDTVRPFSSLPPPISPSLLSFDCSVS